MKDNEINELILKTGEISEEINKLSLEGYFYYLNRPLQYLYINFLAGLARGIGMGIGFTILGGVILFLLQKLVVMNLPSIFDFIVEIAKIVDNNLYG